MLSRKELEHRMDSLTSIIVREKEKRCYSCGKKLSFKNRQAGHFIPRIVKETRWDFSNVHTQCQKCNVELGGNLTAYRNKLIEDNGTRFIELLEGAKARFDNGNSRKMTDDDLRSSYNLYLWLARLVDTHNSVPEEWKKEKCYTWGD